MNVLHIAGWYPNVMVPHEAPFIKRHVDALRTHAICAVWHIDVRQGDRWQFIRKSASADRTFLVVTPLRRWIVIEWIATLLILWAWYTRDRGPAFDVVNFHMAYPNGTHIRLLRWLTGKPMAITEHYSAYREGYKTKSRGAKRIKRIFHAGAPLIVVSRSLEGDIARFAGPPMPRVHVIDNAVETDVFMHRTKTRPEPGRFFAIAAWRHPKRADLIIGAVALLRAQGRDAQLRLAGSGPKDAEVNALIDRLGLRDHVTMLGHLSAVEAADEMRAAHALLHASEYETYSAVCAEALCCGTPVIASAVGGIVEYMDQSRGALVEHATAEAWAAAISANWDEYLQTDRASIAQGMAARCGAAAVGVRYAHALSELITEWSSGSPK